MYGVSLEQVHLIICRMSLGARAMIAGILIAYNDFIFCSWSIHNMWALTSKFWLPDLSTPYINFCFGQHGCSGWLSITSAVTWASHQTNLLECRRSYIWVIFFFQHYPFSYRKKENAERKITLESPLHAATVSHPDRAWPAISDGIIMMLHHSSLYINTFLSLILDAIIIGICKK